MKNKPYRYGLYLLLRGFIFFVRLLPRRAALGLAVFLGSLAYVVLSHERKKTIEHLLFAFGITKGRREIRSIARGVFVNCAKSGVDWILYPRFTKSNWRKLVHWTDEMDRVDRLLALGKGLIMITGHFGNWELIASTFTVHGYQGAVVGRRIYYEPYNRLIVDARWSKGVRTLYRDESPKEILKALKSNQIMGIVADQDVDSIDGIFVPFFGSLAYTPAAPAKLSLVTGAPIVPAFMIRAEDSYRFVMEEPIFPDPNADKDEEIERITRMWSSSIEKYIREFPDQWVWMHRRWKTRPAGTNSEKIPLRLERKKGSTVND